MNNEKILSILDEYVKLIRTPAKKNQTNVVPLTMPGILGHLSWMCKQIPEFLKEGRKDKAQIWLGFIQGSMWSLGIQTDNVVTKSTSSYSPSITASLS